MSRWILTRGVRLVNDERKCSIDGSTIGHSKVSHLIEGKVYCGEHYLEMRRREDPAYEGRRMKAFEAWETGERGELLAQNLLRSMGFRIVPFDRRIEYSHLLASFDYCAERTVRYVRGTAVVEQWAIEVKTTKSYAKKLRPRNDFKLTRSQFMCGYALWLSRFRVGILLIDLTQSSFRLVDATHIIVKAFAKNLGPGSKKFNFSYDPQLHVFWKGLIAPSKASA